MKNLPSLLKTKLPLTSMAVSIILIYLIVGILGCGSESDVGWKTYRHDSERSGVTDELVKPPLSLRWVHQPTHPPKPAWMEPAEELPRMHFDNAHHVSAAKGLVYFGSTVDNKVFALNVATGEVHWNFFTEGPVRYAPTIWKDRVYFGSDDGYVYCLKANNGRLIWKYRPGPSDAKLLGNGRMISNWPVQTSVIVDDGIVYFGAGVFPYEGLYICALDAKNGKIIWKNDSMGDYTHEHQFGGITPQGYLIASEDILYVPSGRNMPAAFNKKTGQFLYSLEPGSKVGGTWGLVTNGELIAGVERSGTPAKVAYDSKTGERKGDAFASFNGIELALTPDVAYTVTNDGICAINRAEFTSVKERINDIQAKLKKLRAPILAQRYYIMLGTSDDHKKLEQLIDEATPKISELTAEEDSLKKSLSRWKYPVKKLHSLILANNVVFAAGEKIVLGLCAQTGDLLWEAEVAGTIYGLAASNGNLFASSDNGEVYCFSEGEAKEEKQVKTALNSMPYPEDELTPVYQKAAETILTETGINKGYCLVLDGGTGRLAFELANRSELKIIAIESNHKKVEIAKKKLTAAGLYGSKIVVESWNLSSLPDYFTNLIVSDQMLILGVINGSSEEIVRVLKPCGGIAFFGQPDAETGISKKIEADALVDWLKITTAPEPEKISRNGNWAKLTRGALPGAGKWTNQYANPQNTACSDDQRVKGPLGVLWYGEPGPNRMVERHGKAASPVAMDGRLFIQGEHLIMAYDSYNGTLLWKREIPGAVRVRVDVDGSNLALTQDGLFVAAGDKCHHLGPATGETIHTYKIPPSPDNSPRRWGYIACIGNTLFGSTAIPLNQEYDQFWQCLANDDGTWKDKAELDAEDALAYEQYVESLYLEADENARYHFQRDGAKWRYITYFPAWEGGNEGILPTNEKMMGGEAVFAINTKTGKLKWVFRGKRIANISISIGDGLVFFADDAVTKSQKQAALQESHQLIRRGVWQDYEFEVKPENFDVRMVVALDAETGQKRWEKPINLTGCGGNSVATAYKDDVLLFFGSFGLHDKWRFPAGELTWRRVTALSTKTREILWSRPLNYMTRPLIINDTVIVEPRACDLRTGKIKTRVHPVTGKKVPWEFYRPGHTCAVTSATADGLFYRSYCTAIYDLEKDNGLTYFGAIRPGCWINLIPANGLLLFPEASSGCTCSFPLRSTVVLKSKPSETSGEWSVYITHGAMTPVKHLAINLGAPGDRKDANGTLWLGYPRPGVWYGIKFKLSEKILPGMGYFASDVRYANIEASDSPWRFASGCFGFFECTVPLIDDIWGEDPGVYTVRLGFAAPVGDRVGQRVFDIKLQDEVVAKDFDIVKAASKSNVAVIKEFNGIKVDSNLTIALVPEKNEPDISQTPILNFIEVIREDIVETPEVADVVKPLTSSKANNLIQIANTELKNNNSEKALEIFHTVLDAAPSNEIKQQALEGLAVIGSPKSLSRIAKYCRDNSPILWDYKESAPELIDSAVRTYVAIANNIAKTDTQKAIKMLNPAFSVSSELELRNKILDDLEKLDANFYGKTIKNGNIVRWHFIGPFPWDEKKNTLDKVFINEPNIDLKQSYKTGVRRLKWIKYVSNQAKVNLLNLFTPNTYVAIYAYAEITLEKDQDRLLKIGSDDGFKCWFNGEVVGSFVGGRAWALDQDIFEVKGKEGVNKILLKIYQGSGRWAFSARVTDTNNNGL